MPMSLHSHCCSDSEPCQQDAVKGPPTPWLRLKCVPTAAITRTGVIQQAFSVWGCSRVEAVLNPISKTYTRQAIVQLKSPQVVHPPLVLQIPGFLLGPCFVFP